MQPSFSATNSQAKKSREILSHVCLFSINQWNAMHNNNNKKENLKSHIFSNRLMSYICSQHLLFPDYKEKDKRREREYCIHVISHYRRPAHYESVCVCLLIKEIQKLQKGLA